VTIKLIQKIIRNNFPLILVILIAAFIGLQNTSIRAYYSGWDNIHAEFDIEQYAKRVFFGAWQSHEGLGGPAAKGHLSEITRLPVLFVLNSLLPNYLVRSSFIFLMYITGGVGMYLYLKKIWIKKALGIYGKWVAGIGSLLYLLHPLTLQQFYISFEIFTVQFAFFPFLLLSIHFLLKKITWKSILVFMVIQLALAPSAHTPTVHYLGIIFSLIYSFFYALDIKKILPAVKFSIFIALLTLLMNSYWILPNLYYGLHNSRYVSESEANVLFGPESLWSIRESNTVHSFLTGFHYLVTWRDYNFESQEHELIFNEWTNHFSNPFRNMQMYVLGIFSILGFFITILNKKRGKGRWAILIIYSLCVSLIWIELFPTKFLILNLYKSKTFLEAFRNPFTKLSILYSFFLIVLFIEFINMILKLMKEKLEKNIQEIVINIFLTMLLIYVVSITAPIFSGNFISEKLKVIFPPEYEKLYTFMKTKNENMRVLEMPYSSREGWVLYNWSTPHITNAYQGIGFYFFGFPQPFLTPDFARWSEVNDFFYQELQFTVDKNDYEQFKQITKKYHVPLVIIDESREIPYKKYNFKENHELLVNAGFKKIWEENFISVYENTENSNELDSFIIPNKLEFVSADLNRVKKDVAFSKVGSYINHSEQNKSLNYIFPFSELLYKQIPNTTFSENKVTIKKSIPKDNYLLEIPKYNSNSFNTTAALQLNNNIISVSFPQHELAANNQKYLISHLKNIEIELADYPSEYFLLVDDKKLLLKNGDIQYLPLSLMETKNDFILFSSEDEKLLYKYIINWDDIKDGTKIELTQIDELKIETTYPIAKANLSKIPSENCTKPEIGNISTNYGFEIATYEANNYGVNCNTLDLSFISPSSSYLLNIQGENFAGRSIKMFINYSIENTIQEEHLFAESKFNSTIPLDKISEDLTSRYFVNWETRSFGRESMNKIYNINVVPYPLENFAEIVLTKIDKTETAKNEIEVISFKKYSNFIYVINAKCANTCYFGIDQAYDDLWIAYDKQNNKILPHFTYNNWANLWEINNNSSEISILYIPQLIALLGMFVATTSILITILFIVKKETSSQTKLASDEKIHHKTKQILKRKN